MMPNVVMAFVLIHALKMTGLLDIISAIFEPVMAIFGLPGAAGIMLIGYWLSMGGGLGVASALYASSALTGYDLVVMAPACYIIGSNIQYHGRVLSVIGTEGKYHTLMQISNFIAAFVAIVIMRIVI
jgi:spore maturation protein SpmB